MALFPLHHEFPCKDHVFQNGTSTRQSKGEVLFDSNGSRRFPYGRTFFPCPAFDVLMKAEVASSSTNGMKHRTIAEATALGRDCRMKSRTRSIPYCLSSRGKLCLVRASSETKITKKKIKLLDSYFGKLQSDDEKPSISMGDETDQKADFNAEQELESLSVYLDKLQKDENSKGLVPSTLDMVKSEGGSVASKLRKTDTESNSSPFQQLDDDDPSEDTLDFYAVSILASINVGVCLFEAASPVRNNNMGLLSLPLLYGAKINDLIMAGEWWRLVTPMFLVQDQQIGSVLPFFTVSKNTLDQNNRRF